MALGPLRVAAAQKRCTAARLPVPRDGGGAKRATLGRGLQAKCALPHTSRRRLSALASLQLRIFPLLLRGVQVFVLLRLSTEAWAHFNRAVLRLRHLLKRARKLQRQGMLEPR